MIGRTIADLAPGETARLTRVVQSDDVGHLGTLGFSMLDAVTERRS